MKEKYILTFKSKTQKCEYRMILYENVLVETIKWLLDRDFIVLKIER